ncbi:hypothetical protein PG994_005600 [Apiospora phragmitis]|uniref:NAD(P)-binding protein n=1 Tax=Apiospora phragmitis TaxID=2905665 RepID=A0ABR1VCQ0_9PEZI
MPTSSPSPLMTGAIAAAAVPAALYLLNGLAGPKPSTPRAALAPASERVCILGASSGLGRDLAKKYAARGAKVCLVARRAELIAALARERRREEEEEEEEEDRRCIGIAADVAVAEDMVAVRERIRQAWGGLDTLHICAGVSALQPVMDLAGVAPGEDASADSIRRVVEITGRATQGNLVGPLVAALTFRTSSYPAILLVSSLAAMVGAPTRALYGSTKASSLLLFQSLAVEHPRIAFTFLLPATIEGNFRASAVDAGPVREADPNKTGLKIDYVANRCIAAVDQQTTGNIFIPFFPNFLAPLIYTLWPGFVEKAARKKYNFEAS